MNDSQLCHARYTRTYEHAESFVDLAEARAVVIVAVSADVETRLLNRPRKLLVYVRVRSGSTPPGKTTRPEASQSNFNLIIICKCT